MKHALRLFPLFVLAVSLRVCAAEIDADLARFVGAKEAQARKFAAGLTNKVPDIAWSFFNAVKVGDWQTATNLGERLERASGRYFWSDETEFDDALYSPVWQTISETLGVYRLFHELDKKWMRRLGQKIIDSIPPGSIYFGGTDPGRFLITALSESHQDGKPFFTLTQNQLNDRTYLDYLGKLYGKKIYVPSVADADAVFMEYLTDAGIRSKAGRLKPGEDVRIVDGKVHASGLVPLNTINGLIVKSILTRNPSREVYIEEQYAHDWMYPHLSPHGLIMKLQAKPLAKLPEEVVRKDQEYWRRLVSELVGEIDTRKTSIKEIGDFAERICLKKDLKDFKGDPVYVRYDPVLTWFSKLRCSIAKVYAWRTENTKDADECEWMQKTADLAFRQAFVICPDSPDVIYSYTQFLINRGRFDDAVLLVRFGLRFDEDNSQFKELLGRLREYSR